MSYIKFYDTTLRDGEQTPGVHFSRAGKVEIASCLAGAGIDVIEAGFPASSAVDFDAVRAVAAAVKNVTVSALARMLHTDIDSAALALAPAGKKRLHVFIATSDIHLEHKLGITREEALQQIADNIDYAKNLGAFDEIEFSAEDATRSDRDFLVEAVKTAVRHGADIINIPDTVGYATPTEISYLIRTVREKVEGDYELSIHCHNDLGLATANSLAAIEAGATQVECTVNGLGERAGNAPLEEIVMALRVRGKVLGNHKFGVKTVEISETSRLVSSLAGIPIAPNKAIVGKNAFAHASGIHQHGVMRASETYEIMDPAEIGLSSNTIVLGKLSGRHAFATRVREIGYSLTKEGIESTFARFKEIAAKKSTVSDEDLRAIIGEYLDSLEGMFILDSFQIQSGNHIKAMALVSLKKRGEDGTFTVDPETEGSAVVLTEAAPGEGPVDAAFNAINRIAGAESTELVSYGITAVTEGTDALGEAKVKIKAGGTTFTGRGVSTDVIKASIKAYLGAINKWKNSLQSVQ